MFLGYLLDEKGHGGKQQQRWQLGGGAITKVKQ